MLLIISLLVACRTMAQTYTYEFNTAAELISGPPGVFKPGESINVKIPFDTVLFKNQIDSLLGNLFQARVY